MGWSWSWRRFGRGGASGRPSRASPLPHDGHVLIFEELHQSLVRPFASQARLLHASERGSRIRNQPAVETDHSEIEAFRHAEPAGQIAREHVRDEPIFGAVGAAYRFVFGGEPLDGSNRTEHLLIAHLPPRPHIPPYH